MAFFKLSKIKPLLAIRDVTNRFLTRSIPKIELELESEKPNGREVEPLEKQEDGSNGINEMGRLILQEMRTQGQEHRRWLDQWGSSLLKRIDEKNQGQEHRRWLDQWGSSLLKRIDEKNQGQEHRRWLDQWGSSLLKRIDDKNQGQELRNDGFEERIEELRKQIKGLEDEIYELRHHMKLERAKKESNSKLARNVSQNLLTDFLKEIVSNPIQTLLFFEFLIGVPLNQEEMQVFLELLFVELSPVDMYLNVLSPIEVKSIGCSLFCQDDFTKMALLLASIRKQTGLRHLSLLSEEAPVGGLAENRTFGEKWFLGRSKTDWERVMNSKQGFQDCHTYAELEDAGDEVKEAAAKPPSEEK